MSPEQIIKRALVMTEKGAQMQEKENKYLFEVHRDANRIEIRKAVEALFRVNVTDVHTMVVRGRMRRMGRGYAKTQNWKKAIVSVREGETIDVQQV
jgi:large subunit ribosomal protein L23